MPISLETHLHIGSIVYPQMDQMDFTGPFEVLALLRNASFHVLWKELTPITDVRGLILTPTMKFSDSPQLDVLIVPGGYGQEAFMEDEVVLSFIRSQAEKARYVFSVCTGALLCGAAGLLNGLRATTHWTAHPLLEYFGATPVPQRVVVDGKYISAAGVTAGIDGALHLVSLLRGDRAAQTIQLALEYAPEHAFNSGSPENAPPEVVETLRAATREISEKRLATARRIAAKLSVNLTNVPAGA